MIWLLLEALSDADGAWAVSFKNGEVLLEQIERLPK